MAALGRHPLAPPSSILLILGLGGHHLRQQKQPHRLPLAARRRAPPSRRLQLDAPRTAAVGAAALHLAFDSPASAADLSVLIPVSAVLLVFYWVANFVVPEMISKDMQPGDQSTEEMLGQTKAGVDEKAAMPGKPFGQPDELRGVEGSTRR